MNRPTVIKLLTLTVAVSGVLTACNRGPSEAEFVQACLKTQATEPMCECAAREARSNLSPDLYTAMVLDMEGKKQEAAALVEDMTFDERAAFAMQQFEILGKCATDE